MSERPTQWATQWAGMSENKKSLYDRLGGVFNIAAVVDHFSDKLLVNETVGFETKNEQLREWNVNQSKTRLPGLKWMRTLWVCAVSGGPQTYVPTRPGATLLGLENAHCPFHFSSDEFDAVAEELSKTLDHFKVPATEKGEVLAAFAAHKSEVTSGKTAGSCPAMTATTTTGERSVHFVPYEVIQSKSSTDTIASATRTHFDTIEFLVRQTPDDALREEIQRTGERFLRSQGVSKPVVLVRGAPTPTA